MSFAVEFYIKITVGHVGHQSQVEFIYTNLCRVHKPINKMGCLSKLQLINLVINCKLDFSDNCLLQNWCSNEESRLRNVNCLSRLHLAVLLAILKL